ncbi:uncharacterized protein C20orf96-like isoform X2 [Hypanus sabinus]|uniref:uncharacterized protein C20orf96-like isoform X2 n=1 Tax=Hypanus sabinus TaxID=79690 RepID=UPI0028C5104D|nr:uncharacterized protein C20orf96-like isoform X2 [Hypanus sabinus]XP_059836940.1 uncharacterized protein C20orf96-like isoform X2 [Hypanus sabinus]
MATTEDCSIVKSLEKKLSMIDYVQWEGTDRHREGHSEQTPSLPPIKWLPEALGNHWKVVKKDKGKTTQEQRKWEAQLCVEKFCSKKCNYRWRTREKISADNACYMELKEKIYILKYLITAKKKQMDEYKEYSRNLLDINMKLVEKLKELEENAMAESRTLLIQYNKFRKGISGVGEWKRQEIEAAKDDLKDTEKTVKQKSEELYSQVEEVNTRIRNAQTELHMLKEFRDKELLIFALKITQLEKEIKQLTQEHQDELVDVEEIILAHKRRMENTLKEKEQEIFNKIAKKQINFLPSGFQEVILHNALMKKEIEVHIELNKNMEKNNLDLQRNLLHLLKSRKDGREQIFTDVFQNQPKCTPDTEIVLDIPREECLPI